uniref:Uncharacterized protein n=1 Tax=Lepisosteus oculatus TaxID=7918 RepID=W5NMZ0_LEPOC
LQVDPQALLPAELCGVAVPPGSKALEYSNGIFDCQSPTSPFMGSLRALQLIEDLRGLLELMETEEKEGLRCQIPDSTAELIVEWLQGHMVGPGCGRARFKNSLIPVVRY